MKNVIKVLTLGILVGVAYLSQAQYKNPEALVNYIHAPQGSLVPDVAMDDSGILHMVYLLNQNAWYIRSADNGASFSTPVKVNSSGSVEFNMGERGPKLAVGTDGTIHVVWMDHWSPGTDVYARYSRSTDGGLSFENVKSVSATPGVDGVTVAADGQNHVYIFWHTFVPAQAEIPQATWLHMSKSTDNGLSFSADTNVVISNHTGLACSMCMTRATCDHNGGVYLAFRSAEGNIRDFYVIRGNAISSQFDAVRVNNDNWNISYCPMAGPELRIGSDGRELCAFMSNNHVYWSVSDTAVSAFNLHIATPLNETDELFPSAISNDNGQALFLWQVGPMSVSDSATVKWALYGLDGSYTGQSGTVGRTFSGTKATSFTGTDGNFYIVTSADFVSPDAIPEIDHAPAVRIIPDESAKRLKVEGIREKSVIRIYNMQGTMISNTVAENDISIDISGSVPGVYLAVINGSRQFASKFVIPSGFRHP